MTFIKMISVGFKDLFRPKWKHSDWKVRENAVKAISDQSILTEVAKTEALVWVRIAAVEKLIDQSQLVEFAKNDKNRVIRFVAVERLTEQSILKEVSENDRDNEISLAASARLINLNIQGLPQSIYTKIALASKGWTKGLTDEEMYDKEAMQMTALERLTDQELIAKVAKDGYSLHVSYDAVRKLTDQTLLANVAENASSDLLLRFHAAKKLTDQVRAQRIYIELIKKIKDMRIEDRPIGHTDIIQKLKDRNLLTEIMGSDQWGEWSRSAARGRMRQLG